MFFNLISNLKIKNQRMEKIIENYSLQKHRYYQNIQNCYYIEGLITMMLFSFIKFLAVTKIGFT